MRHSDCTTRTLEAVSEYLAGSRPVPGFAGPAEWRGSTAPAQCAGSSYKC